jgi:HEAT repeat protein
MKSVSLIRFASTALLAFALTGCEVKPQDIEKWKAEGNTAKLIKALKDSRQSIRLEAINALEELNAENAVAALGALIQDPDVVIVHKSLDALASIGTPSIEPYMLQAITFDTDPGRLTAAKTLGELKSKKAVNPLIVALNDKYENIAVAAAISLGQIGDSNAISALSETASKGSVRLRGASATAIRNIGGEFAVQALAGTIGDLSIKVRNQAIAGLIEEGDAAQPIALEALKSDNDYSRESAIRILEGINKIPTLGEDAVWFQLSSLSIGKSPTIQREEARALANIENGINALVAAVSYPSAAIREHAFLALEAVGEPAAAPLVAAAASASPEARQWFSKRSKWAGAPAWQLDLWGAATALNPTFSIDKRSEKLLRSDGAETVTMLKSEDFRPDRELIPLLIEQMASSDSDDKVAKLRQTLAFRKLRAYQQRSELPLLAAVNADDLQIAALSAQILIGLNDERATQAVLDSVARRVEAGENLHGTPFQDALLELNRPEADALLLRIRPTPAIAIKTVEKKYPDTPISNIPLPPPGKVIEAEPFLLKYLIDGRAKELRVIFRPDENGNWVPNPPLPDELP